MSTTSEAVVKSPSDFPYCPTGARRRLAPVEFKRALHEQGEVGAAWEGLALTLLTAATLPGRPRDLVILRVAFLPRCEYIWGEPFLSLIQVV